eukprot:4917595-Prymnesium_polylepis.2
MLPHVTPPSSLRAPEVLVQRRTVVQGAAHSGGGARGGDARKTQYGAEQIGTEPFCPVQRPGNAGCDRDGGFALAFQRPALAGSLQQFIPTEGSSEHLRKERVLPTEALAELVAQFSHRYQRHAQLHAVQLAASDDQAGQRGRLLGLDCESKAPTQ